MLKGDLKLIIVLVVFSFLLREVLSTVTLLFVFLGSLIACSQIKINKILRNALAMTVFASYWFKYGKVIDPEIGLNFLTSIIVLKILEKETLRDSYMMFFGMILLISSGSLFEKSILYVVFFSLSFLLLIENFYHQIGQKLKLRDFIFSLVWIFPISFLFFFLLPRLMNPIPFQQNTMIQGEIGYTPDVNISEISSLESNTDPVFRVISSRPLGQEELYWRGNTLSYNDGWNWKTMSHSQDEVTLSSSDPVSSITSHQEIKQKVNLINKSDFFFMLDYPSSFSSGKEFMMLKGNMRTLSQKRWNWIQRYEAISSPNENITEDDPGPHYLEVPLSRKNKKIISEMFEGKQFKEISQSIYKYFTQKQFSYSLQPGKIQNLMEFFEKKTGFCSHYASSVAIILRIKKIPTRLVSGFMGGSYNRYANFYLITQNDAHVWVEAFSEGKWIRLDPTAWVSPDRLSLGGAIFVENSRIGIFKLNSNLGIPAFFHNLKLWFNQWDFLFYQWLETVDYQSQEEWLTSLKIKRQWLFTFIPFLVLMFMIIYSINLSLKKIREEKNEHQDLWRSFLEKLNKRGIILSPVNITYSQEIINASKDPVVLRIWNDLVALTFQDKIISAKELKKRIKKI
jgi:hypothetical protein